MNQDLSSQPQPEWIPCRKKYRLLVPSNPDHANDDVFIYAALLDPHVLILADFVAEFGLRRVRAAWETVSGTQEGRLARPHVERMLTNFEKGLRECP